MPSENGKKDQESELKRLKKLYTGTHTGDVDMEPRDIVRLNEKIDEMEAELSGKPSKKYAEVRLDPNAGLDWPGKSERRPPGLTDEDWEFIKGCNAGRIRTEPWEEQRDRNRLFQKVKAHASLNGITVTEDMRSVLRAEEDRDDDYQDVLMLKALMEQKRAREADPDVIELKRLLALKAQEAPAKKAEPPVAEPPRPAELGPWTPVNCPSCSYTVAKRCRFCPECGTKL
jgi:hypothetical protein